MIVEVAVRAHVAPLSGREQPILRLMVFHEFHSSQLTSDNFFFKLN